MGFFGVFSFRARSKIPGDGDRGLGIPKNHRKIPNQNPNPKDGDSGFLRPKNLQVKSPKIPNSGDLGFFKSGDFFAGIFLPGDMDFF